jgi:hypothetical protein
MLGTGASTGNSVSIQYQLATLMIDSTQSWGLVLESCCCYIVFEDPAAQKQILQTQTTVDWLAWQADPSLTVFCTLTIVHELGSCPPILRLRFCKPHVENK